MAEHALKYMETDFDRFGRIVKAACEMHRVRLFQSNLKTIALNLFTIRATTPVPTLPIESIAFIPFFEIKAKGIDL